MFISVTQITPCTGIQFFEPFFIGNLGSMFEPIYLITLAPKHTFVWISYVTEKVNSVANVVYSRLMYFKPHIGKKRLNLASESVRFTFVSA